MDDVAVPLGTGPPTRDELRTYYPAKFTWNELKTFINAGDLGLLKRDKKLQVRYDAWIEGIKEKYGSVGDYLTKSRLQWGKPDTTSLLRSSLDGHFVNGIDSRAERFSNGGAEQLCLRASHTEVKASSNDSELPTLISGSPTYFTANSPLELISVIQNDWPYSTPAEVEHTLIWSRLPIFDFDEVPPQIINRLHQDGLWGFTGSAFPPPSPSTLPLCLPALADWGVTMDKLIRSPKGTKEEDEMVRMAGIEVDTFVRNRWIEREWETAWFVNPLRLQSVPDLSHIHVFARKKSAEEIASEEF